MCESAHFELASQFWLPETPALDSSTRPSITNVAVVARLALMFRSSCSVRNWPPLIWDQ
jgi:hypothetical protein